MDCSQNRWFYDTYKLYLNIAIRRLLIWDLNSKKKEWRGRECDSEFGLVPKNWCFWQASRWYLYLGLRGGVAGGLDGIVLVSWHSFEWGRLITSDEHLCAVGQMLANIVRTIIVKNWKCLFLGKYLVGTRQSSWVDTLVEKLIGRKSRKNGRKLYVLSLLGNSGLSLKRALGHSLFLMFWKLGAQQWLWSESGLCSLQVTRN